MAKEFCNVARREKKNDCEHLVVQDISGGKPKTISRDGVWLNGYIGDLISPDGKWVIAYDNEHGYVRHSTEKAEFSVIHDLFPQNEFPVRWSVDGSSIFVEKGLLPNQIFLVNLKTGKRQLWKELMPADPTGIASMGPYLTPDGKTYAYTYTRWLTDLYVIEGLK